MMEDQTLGSLKFIDLCYGEQVFTAGHCPKLVTPTSGDAQQDGLGVWPPDG